MNLFPVHTYEPKDRPWVIRMLRYLGFLEVIGAILLGIFYGGSLVGPLIQEAFNLPSEASLAITVILGGFVGFCADSSNMGPGNAAGRYPRDKGSNGGVCGGGQPRVL